MTILEAAGALRARQLSARELAFEALKRIAAQNAELNAFIAVTEASARVAAAQADEELASGRDRGPLHGIPVALKDLFHLRGVATTAGSKALAEFVPEENAEVVDRLIAAGAVIVGKTNLHEIAYGITSGNPHYGVVRNPRDRERIPGGSSGGSGAAIVAGMAMAATGSDTGGSIRIPASFCGIVGLKPTYGLVSTRGVMPLGVTLDHAGPMAATVRDTAVFMQAMAGGEGWVPPGEVSIRGLRVGLPENFYFDRVQPEVGDAVRHAARVAERLGAAMAPVRVPDIAAINATARTILLAEAAAVYERFDRDKFGTDVLALLDQGRLLPATMYINAQRARRVQQREFARLWDTVDCLFTPTTPTTAPRIGAATVEIAGEREDVRLATTRFVRGINLLGVPALSLPCGRDAAGLPIGLQIVGPNGHDRRLLQIGAALEDAI